VETVFPLERIVDAMTAFISDKRINKVQIAVS